MNINPHNIENAIVRKFISPDSGIDEARFRYKCPQTGREFHIKQSESLYFLEEFIPIGVWDEEKQARALESVFEKVNNSASPNDFKDALLRQLLGQSSVDCVGTSRYFIIRTNGASGTPIYLKSLTECAEKISEALNSNTYYQAWQPFAEKTINDEIEEITFSITYWENVIRSIDTVEAGSVFKGTYSFNGDKLDPDLKRDILSYFNAPSHNLWDRLYSYRIVCADTLWKAWCDYDPTAPQTLPGGEQRIWPKIPTGEQLREAIQACVASNRERAETRLAEKKQNLKGFWKKVHLN